MAGAVSEDALPESIFEPNGCPHCEHRGFIGRTPLFEAIAIGEGERAMIREWGDENKLENAFLKSGGMDLWGHGVSKVVSGETSLAEVMRVVECRRR